MDRKSHKLDLLLKGCRYYAHTNLYKSRRRQKCDTLTPTPTLINTSKFDKCEHKAPACTDHHRRGICSVWNNPCKHIEPNLLGF